MSRESLGRLRAGGVRFKGVGLWKKGLIIGGFLDRIGAGEEHGTMRSPSLTWAGCRIDENRVRMLYADATPSRRTVKGLGLPD